MSKKNGGVSGDEKQIIESIWPVGIYFQRAMDQTKNYPLYGIFVVENSYQFLHAYDATKNHLCSCYAL